MLIDLTLMAVLMTNPDAGQGGHVGIAYLTAEGKKLGAACLKGDGASCIQLGDDLIQREGFRGKALGAYEKACSVNAWRGCSKLGFRLIEVSREKSVVGRALTLFQRACDRGDALGCSNLATAYSDGEGVLKDKAKAAELFGKACTAGDMIACAILGSLVTQGDGMAADPTRGFELNQRACTGGAMLGCVNSGVSLLQGVNGKKDASTAAALFDRACKQEPCVDVSCSSACLQLGRLTVRGQGVKADAARGKELLIRACTAGLEGACAEAGQK